MKFELSIYGKDDEVIKHYAANRVRWGVLLKAVALAQDIEQKSPVEQLKQVGEILKLVFEGLTDEELELADFSDIMNTYWQIFNTVRHIKVDDSKNV